jgi:holin-like protein
LVRSLAILLGFQFGGEIISRWLAVPIPGSVLGMGLMLAALGAGVVRLSWIEEGAELLLAHLALFFIPAGVGVMVHFDLLKSQWLPVVVATVVSTFVVMAVTGWVEGFLSRRGVRAG